MASPGERMALRGCVDGPLDGLAVPARRVSGSHVWIDAGGRCYATPGAGRHLYAVAGRHRLRFAGHGARRCGGCGAILDADSDGFALDACPLCGAGR